MTTLLPIRTQLTLTEFLAMPETKPAYEYSHGQIWEKPVPQGQHSRLQSKLAAVINLQGEPQQQALALTELRCTFAGRSIVPDIAVFHWSRIPRDAQGEIENSFRIAPDWVIEILSPEQTPLRVINKVTFCIQQGTQLGWVINPEERLVLIVQPQQLPETKEGDDVLPMLAGLEALKLTVNELFNWLRV
jgi:Uma2 family endonuclease